MKVTLNWLREYVDIDSTPDELVHLLTMAGLEAESVEDIAGRLSGLVVGRVLERQPHPNAERLSVCRVDVGGSEAARIVCGAPNVAAGQKVPVVLPGRALPDGTRIGRAELRGVVSEGMICSEAELGLGEDDKGILVLPEDCRVGSPLAEAAGLDDIVLDFEVTPNRPDCLSVAGIAREVAALTGARLRLPVPELRETGEPAAPETRVEIDDPEGCPRYVARVLRQVAVGPSPRWLQDRLRAVGQRPVNNIVDVTNFVMLELGQPLHAFDLGGLREGRIVVRRARPGERLRTLDGTDHELDHEALVIADASRPVALAGLMGGAESEVSEATTDVLLEAACFNPRRVRALSSRLGLKTEASYRFERGVDWDLPEAASARAAALMAEVAGARAAPGCLDVMPAALRRRRIRLRPSRAAALLAVDIGPARCRRILESLGCSVSDGEGVLEVEAPSFRPDLEREIDLVEEVGRVYGYEEVPARPELRGPAPGPAAGAYDDQRRLRRLLTAAGLDEAVTSSIVADDWAELNGPVACRLANPPARGMSSLRTSLIPGLLDVARRNFHQRAPGVALFEVGRVFVAADGGHREALRAGGLLAGRTGASTWRAEQREVDVLDLKGVVESLVEGLDGIGFAPAERSPWGGGQGAEIRQGDRVLGALGQADPALADRFDLTRDTYIFELELPALFEAWSRRPSVFRSLPKFPPVERDLAVVLDEGVPAARVAAEIRAAAPDLVERVDLFDVYQGGQVETGKRSLAFSLRLRSAERTLEDGDADKAVEGALERLRGAFGARLRQTGTPRRP